VLLLFSVETQTQTTLLLMQWCPKTAKLQSSNTTAPFRERQISVESTLCRYNAVIGELHTRHVTRAVLPSLFWWRSHRAEMAQQQYYFPTAGGPVPQAQGSGKEKSVFLAWSGSISEMQQES
jgi:hypothetical protein